MSRHTDDTARPGHPVESFLCAALEALAGLADVPVWSMDEATTDRVVVLAARVAAGVAEVEARAIGQAVALGRPGAAQCRGVKQWLQLSTHVTGRTAARKAALAVALGAWEPTRAALARGGIHAEQAQAIADELDLLDQDVTGVDRSRAEAFLLAEAVHHDADALGRLGHEIHQRLDPEGADAREAEALARAEARARRKTRLRLCDDGEGLTHGSFVIPTLHGQVLRKALTALAAPKHVRAERGAGSYDWQTPTPHKLGQAFCDYVARFPVARLPKVGGLSATVIAIGDAEILEGKVKAARLDTGARISHLELVRLACEAGVIPMWTNADGEVLSMGASTASTPPGSVLRWSWSNATVDTLVARSPATSATSTTRTRGPRAARPRCATPSCCAPSTTAWPTPATRSGPTPCGHRVAACPSSAGSRPTEQHPRTSRRSSPRVVPASAAARP